MKTEVDAYFKKYTAENPPPPPQVFTIANVPKEGNIHLVQKVFQGAFEVRRYSPRQIVLLTESSSISFSLQVLPPSR